MDGTRGRRSQRKGRSLRDRRNGDAAEPAVPQLVLALEDAPGLVQRVLLRVMLKLGRSTEIDLEFARARFEAIRDHGCASRKPYLRCSEPTRPTLKP